MKKIAILIFAFGAFALSALRAPDHNLAQRKIPDRYLYDPLSQHCSKFEIKRFLLSNAPDRIGRQKALFETWGALQAQDYSSLWQAIGPEGGNAIDMAFNTQNNSEIFAAIYSSPAPIFKSANSGQTWERISLIEDYIYGIAVDPANPNKIYASTSNRAYKTTDSGQSWQYWGLSSGFYCYSFEGKMAINSANPDILYLAGHYDESGISGMAVLKSINGGESWTGMKLTPSSQNAYGYTYSIAIDPLNSETVYAGGYYYNGSIYQGKLYKTTDGGQNWTDITGSIIGYPYSIIIDPANPSKVYVGTYSGIYRSSDGGQTWLKNNGYAYASALAIDPSDPNILYAGYIKNCYKSIDGGVTWTQYSGDIYGSCNKLLASSGSSTRLLYASNAGIYRSDDSGLSWQASHSGIKAAQIPALAVASSSPNIIYAEAAGNGFFESQDFGNSWERLPDFYRCDAITKICVNPNDEKDLFILAGG